ncbi:hypothetical protein [Rhizobium herbae]|uniref:Uncharacterized protein n=1 Tax=Rhizobium herbae TaxID=508661 RepID=A0ABS4EIB9_9HYPH|nr:hypothetical protein [Rhizobium herbae]MBP1857680.1 hypothetical protein [Rhizobium herbae]
MIILTGFAIGLLSAGMRSTICYALAGCLIVAVFTLAALFSSGAVSLLTLVLALLSYNAGIAATLLTALILAPRHQV